MSPPQMPSCYFSNYSAKKWTNMNDFWCTEYWENFTLDYTFSHLAGKMLPLYHEKFSHFSAVKSSLAFAAATRQVLTQHNFFSLMSNQDLPSVLWCCWLGVRKGIWPVKIRLMRCWCGYLLERSTNSLHMVSWCHCHPIMSASAKSRMVYPSVTDSPG